MGLTMREYRDADEPAMLRLWSEHGEFDVVDADTWRYRFIENPLERSHMIVAEDDKTGELVAQLICVPSIIMVNGQKTRAARPFAPIISTSMRTKLLTANPLKHPIVQLYVKATELLKEKGVQLSYMLPDPSWQLLYKLIAGRKMMSTTFPFWSRALPLDEPLPLGEGFTSRPIELSDERIDELGRIASRQYPCMILRSSEYLPWKLSHYNSETVGVERGGELVGMVASMQKGGRQWLICDLLAADTGDCLRATLAAVTNLAHERSLSPPTDEPVDKVGLLVTPLMEPVLSELGYARDEYDFHFVVRVLDPDLDADLVAPEKWYLAAID